MNPDINYNVEIIDTWNMTIIDRGVHSGDFDIELPSKPYIAIRLIAIDKYSINT